jgi:hypothetical protein
MARLIPILFILFLFACGSESSESSDLMLIPEDETTDSLVNLSLASNEISNLVLQSEVGIEFPQEVMKYGTLVDGALWNDQRGLNYMVIFQMKEGEFFIDGFKSELHAYHYVQKEKNDSLQELWSIHDSSGVIYKTVDYWGYSLAILDINNDGLAEVEFIYNITPDGLDERELKYNLITKGERLAIVGTWGFENDSVILMDEASSFAFEEYPPLFKSHAQQQFENWIEREKNR